MKKLLIITPHFPPFPRVGTVRRVENFARYLPGYGWQPVVLTMDWGYADRPETAEPRIYHTRNIAALSWNAYRFTRVKTGGSWRSMIGSSLIGIARTIKNWLLLPDELILWMFSVLPRLRKIIAEERPDALYVNAPPFSILLIGLAAKKLYGLPLVSDVRDDWADNPLTEKRNVVLRWIERRMERWVVSYSDKVIVVTPASFTAWCQRYPALKDKLCLIPNGYNEEEFSETAEYTYADFALVHAGSLEAGRSPELIFRSLAAIDAASKKISFYQYGLTIRDYKAMASDLGLEGAVHFEDIINGKEAISRIKGASALVLIPTGNAPTAIPGKTYEYLRTGKPVILISPPNATTDFLKQFPQVYHVLPEDELRCREVLASLAGPVSPAAPGGGDQQENLKKFDRKALTGDLARLLSLAANVRQ